MSTFFFHTPFLRRLLFQRLCSSCSSDALPQCDGLLYAPSLIRVRRGPMSAISVVSLLVLILASPLSAEEADDTFIPMAELFVVADTQERSVLDTPGSVTVLDPKGVEERGMDHFQQLIEFMPSVSSAGGSNRPRFFQIRGVGELERFEGAPNPSVGFLVDEIDLTGLGTAGALFDLEQIEVLRGPQGLRYGTSGLAGLVHLRSQSPTLHRSVKGEFTVGTDDLIAGGLAFGGPVRGTEDRLLVRASVYRHSESGFRTNEFLHRDNTNKRDETTTRLGVTLHANEDLRFDMRILSVEQDNGYDVFTITNSFTTQSDRPGRDRIRTHAGSLKASYTISPAVELVSLSQAARSDSLFSFDGDWGNDELWSPFIPYDFFSSTRRERRNFGQELRVRSRARADGNDSLSWALGLHGFRIAEDSFIREDFELDPFRSLSSEYRANHRALFGELGVQLPSSFSLGGGLRLEQRRIRYEDDEGGDFAPSDDLLGGYLSLSRQLGESATSYILFSQGFKGGGFNSGTRIPEESRQYEAEFLRNLEVGLKGDFWDGMISTSIAGFYGWRRDQQLRTSFQADAGDPLSFTYLTDNAPRSRVYGAEIENTVRATRWLDFFLSGSLLSTKYERVPENFDFLRGRAAAHAPSWQYFTGVRVRPTPQSFVRVDLSGRDRFYFDDSHDQRSSPYSLLGASLGYQTNHYAVRIWGRNLLDKRYATRGFFFGNEPPDFEDRLYTQLGDPRQVGATIEIYF